MKFSILILFTFYSSAGAEEILADVREAEKAIAASKAAADMADSSSKEAKVIGEKAAKDITSLVKVR